jgi:hypothetical protein
MAADVHQYLDFLKEHLPYELRMLNHCFERLYGSSGADWNAFMESFCIHARNLKMFVTNDNGKGNCVVARDFVTDFHEASANNLTGAFQRLNAQIAHLAKTRTTDAAAKFTRDDAKAVHTWLTKVLKKFVAALDPIDQTHWAAAFPATPILVSETRSVPNLPTQTATSIFVEMSGGALGSTDGR